MRQSSPTPGNDSRISRTRQTEKRGSRGCVTGHSRCAQSWKRCQEPTTRSGRRATSASPRARSAAAKVTPATTPSCAAARFTAMTGTGPCATPRAGTQPMPDGNRKPGGPAPRRLPRSPTTRASPTVAAIVTTYSIPRAAHSKRHHRRMRGRGATRSSPSKHMAQADRRTAARPVDATAPHSRRARGRIVR